MTILENEVWKWGRKEDRKLLCYYEAYQESLHCGDGEKWVELRNIEKEKSALFDGGLECDGYRGKGREE